MSDFIDVFHLLRFYRVREDHQNDIQGKGLGLAIVKSIAEWHGRQVSMEITADRAVVSV